MSGIEVAILGSSGVVGRVAGEKIANHKYFEIGALIGNSSAGRTYGEVWRERERKNEEKYPEIWQAREPPKKYEDMLIERLDIEELSKRVEIAFSLLPANEKTKNIEKELAKSGIAVYSASNTMRLDKNIPLIIAEVNPFDLKQIYKQEWMGSISKKPNCLTTLFVLSYFPIYEKFGLKKAKICSYQSVCGMGDNGLSKEEIWKGIRLEGEEEKTKTEPYKIMNIKPNSLEIEAVCNRVYVARGHRASIRLRTKKSATKDEIIDVFKSFNPLKEYDLPSSPKEIFIIKDELINPLEDIKKDGMSIIISNIEANGNEILFDAFSDNLDLGAIGGLILNAELCKELGL